MFFALILITLILGSFYFYSYAPGDPVELEVLKEETIYKEDIDYGDTPVFLDNLRFREKEISYYIDFSCSRKRQNSMIDAFEIFEQEVGILSFFEVFNKESAKIFIHCSKEEIEISDTLFAAGEGGPSKIINTSYFNIIEEGKILLYKDQKCENPVVEIHELGHVLGFNHSEDPENVMYPVSRCEQKIMPDMKKAIEQIYHVPSISDGYIEELSAVKRGSRIDFNITITNIGLDKIENMSLDLIYNGKSFETFYLEEIGVGYGRTLTATNVRLPSRNVDVIDFVLDKENLIQEINEDNNLKTTYISPK